MRRQKREDDARAGADFEDERGGRGRGGGRREEGPEEGGEGGGGEGVEEEVGVLGWLVDVGEGDVGGGGGGEHSCAMPAWRRGCLVV